MKNKWAHACLSASVPRPGDAARPDGRGRGSGCRGDLGPSLRVGRCRPGHQGGRRPRLRRTQQPPGARKGGGFQLKLIKNNKIQNSAPGAHELYVTWSAPTLGQRSRRTRPRRGRHAGHQRPRPGPPAHRRSSGHSRGSVNARELRRGLLSWRSRRWARPVHAEGRGLVRRASWRRQSPVQAAGGDHSAPPGGGSRTRGRGGADRGYVGPGAGRWPHSPGRASSSLVG